MSPLASRTARGALVVLPLFLSGCILFPPFGFGSFDQETLAVENATASPWVLRVAGDFPDDYAIPPGETGEVLLYGGTVSAVMLLTTDCEVVDELDVRGDLSRVRIDGDGQLSAQASTSGSGSLTAFVDYYECFAGGAAPELAAAVPGATGTLLLVGAGDLWSLRPAEGVLTQLSVTTEYEEEPAWSPDGERVVFVRYSDRDMRSELYVMNADGTDVLALARDAGAPAWSPDGSMIAFVDRDPFSGGSALTVIPAAGGDARVLARGASSARWSPDGALIAFASDPFTASFDELSPAQISVVAADGSALRTLAENGSPYGQAPVWSPDGTRLAYVGVEVGPGGPFGMPFAGAWGGSALITIDLDGNAEVLVEESSGDLEAPAWSPDGERLVFASWSTGLRGSLASLGIVSAAGGEVQKLATEPAVFYSAPAWSPDGRYLAVGRMSDATMASDLVIVDIELDQSIVVLDGDAQPADWRP